jgi:hypothetical protein
MRFISLIALSAWSVALAASPTNQAPARDTLTARVGSSVVRGRVVALVTGRPLALARLTLSGDGVPTRHTLTGEDGRYEFRNVPAGRFSLTVFKETYLTLSYGQTRPFQAGRLLTLGEGQTLDDANFSLPKAAAILGVVVDEFGDPVVDVGVTPMRTSFKDGRMALIAGGPRETTNDLGEFRLSGLQPGSYVVAVDNLHQREGMPIGAVTQSSLIYVPTYAPGTTSLSAARRVTVALGQSIMDVNVVLTRVRGATISGMVLDAEGQPVARGSVELFEPGVPAATPNLAPIGLNPTINRGFSFTGVAPGTYELRATSGFGTVTAAEPARAARGAVTVNGENVTVKLTPVVVGSVRGRISFSGDAPQNLPASAVAIAMRSADPAEPLNWNMHWKPVPAAGDMTFTLSALPGRWILTPSLPKGWALRSVRRQGVDLTDAGVNVDEGEHVTDVEIELTNRLPRLAGTVRTQAGGAADDYTVLVFAADPARRTNPRYFAILRPDQAGGFSTDTLAPGEYYAVALEYVDINDAQDPDLLGRLAWSAAKLTLQEGDAAKVELKLTTP